MWWLWDGKGDAFVRCMVDLEMLVRVLWFVGNRKSGIEKGGWNFSPGILSVFESHSVITGKGCASALVERECIAIACGLFWTCDLVHFR
jgi:hypothetical protein